MNVHYFIFLVVSKPNDSEKGRSTGPTFQTIVPGSIDLNGRL